MCALPSPPFERLAEALVTAAESLSPSSSEGLPLALPGVPVRSGRVALGRLRHHLPSSAPVLVPGRGQRDARWGQHGERGRSGPARPGTWGVGQRGLN